MSASSSPVGQLSLVQHFFTALEEVNTTYSDFKLPFSVLSANEGVIHPKGLILLLLKIEDGKQVNVNPIGVIHLVHLKDTNEQKWSATSLEQLARTIDEIKEAIFFAAFSHIDALPKWDSGEVLINGSGIKLYHNGHELSIDEEKYLVFEGERVKYGGKPLLAARILVEGTIQCKVLENGDLELVNEVDQRDGMRMCICKLDKEIYFV